MLAETRFGNAGSSTDLSLESSSMIDVLFNFKGMCKGTVILEGCGWMSRHDEILLAFCPGPCPHSGLKTTLDCDTNTAVVSWTPGSGILYYNATADAFDITHQQTCSTNSSSCNITSLRCGETYKVNVRGQGQNCPSPAQDWNRINTGRFTLFLYEVKWNNLNGRR